MRARAYTVPTDQPEQDGTLDWDKTTLVVVNIEAGGHEGIGYTYAAKTNAALIAGTLARSIAGRDAFDIAGCTAILRREIRNLGGRGLAATAISAVDIALWDLKAKLLDLPLVRLLGVARAQVPIYGSGGFTNYTDARLAEQLGGWVARDGCRWVKMKIGRDAERDRERVKAARAAIGDAGLFVDANGAFTAKEALAFADDVQALGVRWFEEPVSSDDLSGLRLLRARMPAPIEVAAGEYHYVLDDMRAMLAAGCVDVMQADATRCGGVSGFLAAGTLTDAHHLDLSGHCAPSVHLHAACAVQRLRHLEWFHDHVRIEHMLFDGAPVPRNGMIEPDLSRAGLGIVLKRKDAERYVDD
ncbi:MAG TPA: enolase C-terminal domain-like protein [Acetobacteraceae bacterium]